MGRNGRVNFSELENFKKDIEKSLGNTAVNEFIEDCAKELAARLLAKVIERTPVGRYDGNSYTCISEISHKGGKVKGKVGGTLRRGWTAGKSANAYEYVNSLNVKHIDNKYIIEVINPVKYAEYVEFGHRTRGGKGWVEGHKMLTVSEYELQSNARSIIEHKLKKELEKCFK